MNRPKRNDRLEWAPLKAPEERLALWLTYTQRLRATDEWASSARDPRGRKQTRSLTGALATMLATVDLYQHAQVSVIDKLEQGLSDKALAALGIARHGPPQLNDEGEPGVNAAELPVRGKKRYTKPQERVHRHLSRLADAIEYSRFHQPDLTEGERQQRRLRQIRVLDDLVAGPLAALPTPDLLSVDATGIRGYSDKDPDMTPTKQTPTHRDPLPWITGLSAHALVGVNLADNFLYPQVAWRFRLGDLEDTDHATVALELLDRWLESGRPPRILVGDSLYQHAVDWSVRLAERGCAPVGELHPQDAGDKGVRIGGASVIDGCLHCPFSRLPALGSPVKEGQALDDYRRANRQRRQHACELVVDPDTDLLEQTRDTLTYICPAQAMKVRCPLWPTSMELHRGHPTVEDPPPSRDRGPDVCQGPLTTSRGAHGLRKTWQPYYYGSDEWRRYFTAGRVQMEGLFGNVFSDAGPKAVIGNTNWVGQARTAWVLAASFGVVNVRLVRTWWERPQVRAALSDEVRQALDNDPLFWHHDRLRAALPDILESLALAADPQD